MNTYILSCILHIHIFSVHMHICIQYFKIHTHTISQNSRINTVTIFSHLSSSKRNGVPYEKVLNFVGFRCSTELAAACDYNALDMIKSMKSMVICKEISIYGDL